MMKLYAPVVLIVIASALGPLVASNAQGPYYPPSPPRPSPPTQSAGPSPKGDVKLELKTAITHAEFAANADALQAVQLHLGHVINCIEGPKGKNFNASWGNPCEGQGNSILTDLKAVKGGTALVSMVQRADNQALTGRKTKKIADAKKAAKQAMNLLQQASTKVK